MQTDLFHYNLPPERIAQTPVPRGTSRLLVMGRETGQIAHRHFPDILDYIGPGDTLVLNDTRVTARRLQAVRENGLPAEVMLLRPVGETRWETLVKPGKSLRPGKSLLLMGPKGEQIMGQVVGTLDDGGRVLEFADAATRDRLAHWGETPLPPYITTPLPPAQEERYQTVYAQHDGSAAAPTAGLHFTPEILQQIEAQGAKLARLTLHVGVGTFRPVRTDDTDEHIMHHESVTLSEECADTINATRGRVIAIGTTSVRALESAAQQVLPGDRSRRVLPFHGETDLFITPGYAFRAVDGLLTNFHLPHSTLLMLVSAFAGRHNVLYAYETAVQENYRFFSFGDAMLII